MTFRYAPTCQSIRRRSTPAIAFGVTSTRSSGPRRSRGSRLEGRIGGSPAHPRRRLRPAGVPGRVAPAGTRSNGSAPSPAPDSSLPRPDPHTGGMPGWNPECGHKTVKAARTGLSGCPPRRPTNANLSLSLPVWREPNTCQCRICNVRFVDNGLGFGPISNRHLFPPRRSRISDLLAASTAPWTALATHTVALLG